MSFRRLLYDLAGSWNRGATQGLESEQAYRQNIENQVRGFRALTPIREAQEVERRRRMLNDLITKSEVEEGPEVGNALRRMLLGEGEHGIRTAPPSDYLKGGLSEVRKRREEEFTVRSEDRKRAAELAEREELHTLLAPIAARALPPVAEERVAPEATAEVLRERPVTQYRPARAADISRKTSLPAYKEVLDLLTKQSDVSPKTPSSEYQGLLAVEMGGAYGRRPPTPDEANRANMAFEQAQRRLSTLRLRGAEEAGPTRAQRQLFMSQYVSAPPTRRFIDARDAYSRLEALGTSGSPASDIGMIYQFMRSNDPESTVRDPEVRMAERAGSLATRIRNAFMHLKTGERLTPEQRRDFLTVAGRIFESNIRNQQDFEEAKRADARALGMPETDVPDVLGRYRIRPGAPGSGRIIKDLGGGFTVREKP